MPDLASNIILCFAYLSIKHMAGDFFLQTPYQLHNKGIYGHPGGLLHAFIHVVLTLPVFWILPPAGFAMAIAIVIGEFVTHYHIDWLKERVVDSNHLTVDEPGFWYALGVDQMAHGLTYVVIVALLAGVVL